METQCPLHSSIQNLESAFPTHWWCSLFQNKLTFHLHNGCHEKNPTHWLISPNICIENVSWIITTSHAKSKIFFINVKISYPILGDCDKSVFHNITKNLEVFMLVVNHKVTVHHKNINLANLYNCHQIKNEHLPSLGKYDQGIHCLQ